MNQFDAFVLKLNFKKITLVYTVAAIIATVICVVGIGIVFKANLAFAWRCNRISDAIETAELQRSQSEINALAVNHGNVVDIINVDKKNQVTASAKNSAFGTGQFKLTLYDKEEDFFISETDPDVVFWYIKDDEFLLAAIISDVIITHQYANDSRFTDKTIEILSDFGEEQSGERVYLISTPVFVRGGNLTLISVVITIILFLIVNAVLFGLWAYQNARKAKLRQPLFWGIFVMITNTIGALIYQIYKHASHHDR